MGASAFATGDFYEEPAQTLADYLRRDQLPAKSVQDIHDEMSKPAAGSSKTNITAELVGLTKKPGPEALASLDKMIAAARAQADNPLLNLLHDFRDLFAGPATAAETQAYVDWRIGQADRFGAVLDEAKRAEKKKPGEEADAPAPPSPELIADIERQLAKASPALKPHWLYLRGAVEYLSHNIPGAQKWFLKVARDFPKSPRAEVALYMAARCQMWRTRSQDYTQQDMKLVAAERPEAKKLLDEYLAKYPHGTHFGDVLGWSGAYAFDGEDFATALRFYAQQLDLPDHPELTDMAAEMVEKTLSHIASKPQEKSFAEVAKYPQAAQALVYLVINTSESDNYNGKFDSIDEVRGWRKKVLPRLAAAISAQSKLYQSVEWKPRYLAMLAYAASGAGQQDQAAKLLESVGASAEQSDDLLMARGVVFHRDRHPAEAVKALETLLDKFPKSPLVPGVRLRLALALTDDHRAGQAVLALKPLIPEPKPADGKANDANADTDIDDSYEMTGQSPILYPIDKDQVRALIDVLLNFGPVEELAAAAQTPKLDPVERLQLTEAIAQRLLAKEQFDEAKKFMTPAQFGLVAESLEKLTQAARDAKEPAARAAACLKLGDAWAAARGKLLTYPLDTNEWRHKVYLDGAADANIRRADSAPFIGAPGNFRLDLENRDELRHAFNWWLEASDAQPGTPATAQPLWRAIKAMPRIADVSPYTVERAASRKWGEVAHKLADRLRAECPDSIEAKRYAVTWSFPPMKKPNPDDGNYPIFRDAAGGRFSGSAAPESQEASGQGTPDYEPLMAQITSLETEAGGVDLAKARAKAEGLRVKLRPIYADQYDARWVNLVDDLALFLSEPDPGVAVRTRYAAMRFRFARDCAVGGSYHDETTKDPDETMSNDIKTALADPATKPVADYFEFLRLAIIANHLKSVDMNPTPKKEDEDVGKDVDTYTTRDYPELEKQAHAFLEKHPHSKKREAATLLYARAVFRASDEIRLRKLVMWPQGARWEGGYEFRYTQQEPFDAKKVLAALDAYDRAYPKGLYAADIRNYRAAVALRQHEWKTALDLAVAQLTGSANRGLDVEADIHLGKIFAQLADERYRADIMAAIKENKKSQELLAKYIDSDDDTNPLLYLKAWVQEQLAAK